MYLKETGLRKEVHEKYTVIIQAFSNQENGNPRFVCEVDEGSKWLDSPKTKQQNKTKYHKTAL